MKLCVIGAGAAGLSAIKNGVEFGYNVTAFEQTAEVGGTWVFTEEVCKDKYGLDVHSCMYKGLHTNIPKEIMNYPEFPFPENERSYVPSAEVLNYYQLYADKFSLRDYIKFEHYVVRVRPLLDDSWEVIVRNLPADKYETHVFDAILVCNGHYHTPNWPKIEGQKLFKGKQLHSRSFRSGDLFKGEKVLIIGAGPSGVDLTLDISKKAEKVTWSHHLDRTPAIRFGKNVDQKPDVKEMTKNGVIFEDGTYHDYSFIVYCTGYKNAFPFLSVDCGVSCDSYLVYPLYKHLLNVNRPSMAFIGLLNFICPNPVVDLQMKFFLKYFSGGRKLPAKEEMLEDIAKDKSKRTAIGFRESRAHYLGAELQEQYLADLAETGDLEPVKPVMSKLFAKGLSNLYHDSSNFRNYNFKLIDDENFVILSEPDKENHSRITETITRG